MLTQPPSHLALTLAPDSLPLDQHPAEVYLNSLASPQSRRTMRTALNNLAILVGARPVVQFIADRHGRTKIQDLTYLSVDWAALRFQHTAAIRAKLVELYKPATANKTLAALRGVLNAAYDLGQMDAADYQRAMRVKSIKGEALPAGRGMGMGEILALVNACKADHSPAGSRDVAMLGVLYATGLRRAEVVALDLTDYDTTSGRLIIRRGKGQKARTVYLSGGAKLALDVWLVVRGSEAGPLFCVINKAGKLFVERRMSTQAAYKILQKRAKQAGVRAFSPHDLRRTFVGDMLDRGADIATVAKLAGHASVTTTARYDRRDEETKKKAAGLLHFPF
jgi:site-specific recombinase XerD